MANSLYIAGAAPRSGKSAVSLGFMELFSAYGDRVGFFRPIVAAPNDSVIALMMERYRLSQAPASYYGCLAGEAHELTAAGNQDELVKAILEKFKALEAHHDLVICEGSDFSGAAPGLEFDFNLELANHLGCMVAPVLNGKGRQPWEIGDDIQAIDVALAERHCQVFAIVVNRTPVALRREVPARTPNQAPLYLLAEQPILDMPTVGEVAAALGAERLSGNPDADGLSREVLHFKVAAMELPHFLDHVEDGSLIITPGDRSDIIVGALLADASAHYPRIAGLLLTGGLPPAPQILKLIDGLADSRVPLLMVAGDTYTTATAVHAVEPHLSPGNPRKVAAALGLLEGQVNRQTLNGRFNLAAANRTTPLRFEYELIQRAKQQRKHIVLPEGAEERILKAAEILLLRDVADITLLGDPEQIRRTIAQLGLRLDKARIVDPTHDAELRQRYADALHAARKHKGVTPQMAWDMVEDVSYFGTLMVHLNDADGMVSGALHTTQHTIRPAFQVIRTQPGASLISSVFLMSLPDQVVVYGDCAVNPDPTAQQLAEIAITAAATAERFGIEPRIAMLSYSTGDSGSGQAVDKVREAVRIARQRAPQLKLEGPIQYDAAVDAAVARTKLPDSEVAGHATVFIFPDLNTGNNTYKAVQRTSGAVAIGPILQGLNKPVNDLSRGCSVTDIVNTVAITAIQAQRGG